MTTLYISCFTSDFEIMRQKWSLKKQGLSLNDKQMTRYESQMGSILQYSWEDDTITSEITQDCPFGMLVFENQLFVCDARLNKIIIYDTDTLTKTSEIVSPLFNDIHSIVRDGASLLITSTGVDTVVRVSLEDLTIEPVVSFVASTKPLGVVSSESRIDPMIRYDKLHIDTESQVTHLNYAARLSDDTLGINLFHQGILVSYKDDQISTVVTDLHRSHSFFEYKRCLYVADSGNHCVKLYSVPDFKLLDKIEFDGWVQDIKRIDINGQPLMFASDADNSIIRVYDLSTTKLIRTITLPNNYRISSCELRQSSI